MKLVEKLKRVVPPTGDQCLSVRMAWKAQMEMKRGACGSGFPASLSSQRCGVCEDLENLRFKKLNSFNFLAKQHPPYSPRP